MKKLLKPTRAERELIQESGLNAANWNVERKNHETLTLVHKVSGKSRIIKR